MNRWTISVEDFGKIKMASIEVTPFTAFIGDNNSGKSYMMSLIYGLQNLEFYTDNIKFNKRVKSYKFCYEWLKTILVNMDDKEIKLDETIQMEFIKLINAVLKVNKEHIVKNIFNNNINIGKLEIDFPFNKNLVLSIETHRLSNGDARAFYIYDSTGMKRIGVLTSIDSIKKMELDMLLLFIMDRMFRLNFESGNNGGAKYLPTSRTGFVLTYKTLTERSLDEKFNIGVSKKNLLTRPCSDFLIQLSTLSATNMNKEYQDVIDFIEEQIVDGKVYMNELPSSDLMYVPHGSNSPIPMFVSSGVITEMTPLLMFLKYKNGFSTLMMEEPEMCMHPKLQWLITRALIQLVNANMNIIITTHSDTILQHINNMIKLTKNNNKMTLMKEYNYNEKDLIKEDTVRMYQFDVENHCTTVTRLVSNEYGFVASTFNDMLTSLLEESRAFESED